MKTNYKGLVIYSYKQKQAKGGYRTLLCVADPNHNYPYDAIGITLASGFRSSQDAKNWIDKAART